MVIQNCKNDQKIALLFFPRLSFQYLNKHKILCACEI